MRWISRRQQQRDHNGAREVCAACGHTGTSGDPLALSDGGFRVHRRHLDDPNSGLHGKTQK